MPVSRSILAIVPDAVKFMADKELASELTTRDYYTKVEVLCTVCNKYREKRLRDFVSEVKNGGSLICKPCSIVKAREEKVEVFCDFGHKRTVTLIHYEYCMARGEKVKCRICYRMKYNIDTNRKRREASGDRGFRSLQEEEFYNYIVSLGLNAKSNCNDVISPKEIDVFIPELSIGIEYNGVYWHSDKMVKTRTGLSSYEYHKLKYELARKAGVKLLFVWSEDWLSKTNDVKSALERVLLKGGSSKLLTKFEF